MKLAVRKIWKVVSDGQMRREENIRKIKIETLSMIDKIMHDINWICI